MCGRFAGSIEKQVIRLSFRASSEMSSTLIQNLVPTQSEPALPPQATVVASKPALASC
jgi:hypothetical protein